MHHCALRHLPSSPAIPHRVFPFSQALQAAAGRAWARRAHSAPSTTLVGISTPISSQSTKGCGRMAMGYKLAFGKVATTKRCIATSEQAQIIESCAETEVEEEQNPRLVMAAAAASDKDVTQVSPPTASSSKQETRFDRLPTTYDASETGTQHTDTSESHDSVNESQPQDTDTLPTPTIKTTSTLPHKLVLIPQTSPPPNSLRFPTTQKVLYNNLRLALFMKPLPHLPALIDYHDSFPSLRSTRSYDFLIELSIRHSQFGTTRWLFDAMVQDRIPQSPATHRLRIRWLVRTGNWEQAWTLASGLSPEEALDKPLRNGLPPIHSKIPWNLWMELLSTTKRDALRLSPRIHWATDKEGNKAPVLMRDTVTAPTLGARAYQRRQQLLACVHPKLTSKRDRVRPVLVKAAVQTMLHDRRTLAALELVKKYFTTLPRKLRGESAAQCMEIIHLLLSGDTRNGLASLYANLKLLRSLLKIRPTLKASSTTLLLILAPLKRAKKGGTVASHVMKQFQTQWGPEVVDSRVRRRICTLARKEGREDIIRAMLKEEIGHLVKQRATRPSTPKSLLDLKGLRRLPNREVFSHKGRGTSLWITFRRIHFRRLRREQSSAGKTVGGTGANDEEW